MWRPVANRYNVLVKRGNSLIIIYVMRRFMPVR